jgi:hypothetical protein
MKEIVYGEVVCAVKENFMFDSAFADEEGFDQVLLR